MSTIFFDISNLQNLNKNISGIPRLSLTILHKLYLHFGATQIAGISFSNQYQDYKIFDLQEIKETCVAYVDMFDDIPDIVSNTNLIKNGDIFLILGEPWDFPQIVTSLNILKSKYDIKIYSIVHDLMPFFLPELYMPGFPEEYKKCYSSLLPISTKIFYYSEATKNDLLRYYSKDEIEKKLERIHLGGDINLLGRNEPISLDVQNKLQNKEYIIYVSSFSARKNHFLLIYVWRMLLDKFGDKAPYLVLVGSVNNNLTSNTLDLIARNPLLNEKILIFSDVSNATLTWLYKNALFSIFPSIYEGWGLPVSESLTLGKFCIASTAGSLPENGSDFVVYFNPYDSGALFNLVCKYFENRHLIKDAEAYINSEYKKTTWDDCANEIIKAIENDYENSSA